jgi:lipopolysaccharide/colanic/teichoic acid biosynthesis glycosyltransferase
VTSKRVFDFLVASVVVVLTAPLIAVLGAAIKLDSPGPMLFRTLRVGRDGRPFHLLKLRTMAVGSDRAGLAVTASGDARVTRVGRWLRRLKLDEVPQFVNVARGEMSIVGPRPEHPDFVRRYTETQLQVLTVRPGITSLASLEFSDEEELLVGDANRIYVEDVMPAKLALDLEYVRRRSLGLDLAIIGRTASLVLSRILRRPVRS